MSAGRLTVIAYQWEADRYCGRCTASHFVPNTVGMLTRRPDLLDGLTLEEWVDREALTHEWIDAEIEQSAAYIAGWRRALSEDSKLIVTASSAAQKAADWITGEASR